MNKKIKIILGYLILFIESILLCFILMFMIINKTILDKNYVIDKMEKTDFYNLLHKSIKTEMSYYTEQSGFEDDILDDTFTIEEIKTASNSFVDSIYDGTKIEIDSTNFQKRLNGKIDDYIEKSNFKIINEEEINKFVEKLSEIYTEKIQVNSVTNSIGSTIKTAIDKSNTILIVSVVSLIVLMIINMFLFKRTEWGVLFLFVSFIFITINIYINNVIDLKHLFVYNQVITNVVKLIIDEILCLIVKTSIISLVIGLILSVLKREKKSE